MQNFNILEVYLLILERDKNHQISLSKLTTVSKSLGYFFFGI